MRASTSGRVTLSDKDERISDKDLDVQLQLLSSGRVGMENPGESLHSEGYRFAVSIAFTASLQPR